MNEWMNEKLYLKHSKNISIKITEKYIKCKIFCCGSLMQRAIY